jgi:hypothetical protein
MSMTEFHLRSRPARLVALAVALVAMVAYAVAGFGTSSSSSAAPRALDKVTTTTSVAAVHTATAANLARVAALAKKSTVARAYIGTHDTDGDGDGNSKADSHYCNGCEPPLAYTPQAPVINTTGTTGLTITPIYWAPTGKGTFPANYQTIINGYIKNVAAASGSTSNVYSVLSEYYSTNASGAKQPIRYKITAGTPIIDTGAFPARDSSCELSNPTQTDCVTDAQERTELTKLKTSKGLTFDLAHIYPIFLAPGVETYDLDGTNSVSSFCGYHRSFASGATTALYGNEPYSNGDGCGSGQDPNGLLSADTAIDVLSHEISEAVTDPTDIRAWNAVSGHEIGDICSGNYGPPLGFAATTAANPDDTQTAYNQVINGGKYYTQTEFSNAAYSKLGVGNGCITGEAKLAAAPVKASVLVANASPRDDVSTIPVVGSLTNDAFPNTLPADGTSTSVLDVSASTPDGFAIADDPIHYTIYAIDGDGECGTLSANRAVTDNGGHAHVTYTASTDDVLCAVVANDLYGGQDSTGMIYQGSFQDQAIRATNTYPTSLTVGATTPTNFQIAFLNPATTDKVDSRINFSIFPGEGATDNVDASQVNLSYSTDGKTYQPVDLHGSTIDDGAIQADILPAAGVTIAAGKTLTVSFRIQLAGGIDTSGGGAGMYFESYLQQIDPGSGAVSIYGDTLAEPVTVVAAAPAEPNLVVTAISASPTAPHVGDGVVFSAKIANTGTTAVPAGTPVAVSFSIDGKAVSYYGNLRTGLAAGASTTVTANWGPNDNVNYWVTTAGKHTLTATVDYMNLIAESNETDNSLSIPFNLLPNLQVTAISPVSAKIGQHIVFGATFTNTGVAAVPAGTPVTLSFSIDGKAVSYYGYLNTGVPAGTSVKVTANWGPNSNQNYWTATAGKHTLTATADYPNAVTESNESDNSLSTTFTTG